MKRSPHEPLRQGEQEAEQERGLQALADLMRAGAAAPTGAQEHRRRFLQTWQQSRHQPRRRFALWMPLATTCALALVVAWQWHTTHAVLQVVATRGGTSAEPSVGAMMPEGTELRFSEGTLARVENNSRAMVSRLGARGATVTLAEGSLHLKVVKRPDAAWRVEAGPYLVQVTGTQFDVHWNEARKRFQIDLHEGSVRVSGPSIASPQALTAGHTLRVDGQDAAMTIIPLQTGAAAILAKPAPSPVPVPEPTAAPLMPRSPRWAYVHGPSQAPQARRTSGANTNGEAPAVPSATPEPSAAAAMPAPVDEPAPALSPPPVEHVPPKAPASWSHWLMTGDFAAIVADALALNVDAVVSERPLADVQALADAGRYTGNAAVARQALQALRQRFSQKPAAQKAAFELGRLEDDHAHAPARAVPWYSRYLAESPRGAFAEDALVRLMMAHVALKHHDQATLDAEKYLQLYPTGGHSDLAKKVLRRGHSSHP